MLNTRFPELFNIGKVPIPHFQKSGNYFGKVLLVFLLKVKKKSTLHIKFQSKWFKSGRVAINSQDRFASWVAPSAVNGEVKASLPMQQLQADQPVQVTII